MLSIGVSGLGIERGILINRWLCFSLIIWIASVRETRQSSVIIVRDDNCDPCYRKLLAGKRIAENHVRRIIQCNRIEECHRMCEYESSFVCEGFSYGAIQPPGRRNPGGHGIRTYMCQLTSMSGNGMDLRRDFVADSRYDYYQRDWRCPAEKYSPSTGNDWSNESPRPFLPSRSRPPPHRLIPNEIPNPFQRPIDPNRGIQAPGDTRYYLPEKQRPPVNRPLEYDYYPPQIYNNPPPRRPTIDVHYNRQPPQQQYFPDYYYPQPTNPARPYGIFPKYPDRRIDQNHGWRGSRPESSIPNDILPSSDHHWEKPNSNWPVSHAVYGPSYGYNTNHYPGNIEPPPRRIGDTYPRDQQKPQKRPIDQQDYYGYHYGPAYGYGGHDKHPIDSYVPNWKPEDHQSHWPGHGAGGHWGGSRDCSVRSATGFKLARKIIDASYTTANLEECELLCASRTDCLSFAYRYSLAPTAPTDNCLLSNVNFSKLNFYTELVPDRDYDIYAIIGDPRNCQGSRKPSTDVQPHQRLPEECFWRVRSGFGMPLTLTRKELRVEKGLGECQIACISSRLFTCRSFVFRYEFYGDRGPNCFLSDCPTSEIDPAIPGGLPHIDNAELYERGSYGRGCEPYPFATIYNPGNIGQNSQSVGGTGDEGCYSGYQGGCKLSPYAVSSISRVDSETECRRKCSRLRNNPRSPCMSFSFKIGDEKRGDNCYLSDVPRRDLRPGLDYTFDDDYVMYAWKELEPQCSIIPGGGYPQGDDFPGFYQIPGSLGPGSWSSGDTPDGGQSPIGLGPGTYNYNNLVLGVRPLDPDRPDPVNPGDYGGSLPPHQNDDGYSFAFGSSYPDGYASFNRYYTVNGYPCKRGTKCEKNQIAGFWSCEPEGSELGSWDYCCEPNHHCGFSRGYRYPWCYVGPSEDQWRPCSDKYFPYLPSPRPGIRPQNDEHGYRNLNGHGPPYQLPGQSRSNDDSSTYHSRHWPIAFLHPEPPPNTTDSVALANDRRDDETINNTQTTTAKKARISSAEIKNSSITRLHLHKSHLKRRGLVSNNRTRQIQPKDSYKKFHRISIIPAFEYNASSNDSRFPNHSIVKVGTSINYRDSNNNNNSSEILPVKNESDSSRKPNPGRIERVVKPGAGNTEKKTVITTKTHRKTDALQREQQFSGDLEVSSANIATATSKNATRTKNELPIIFLPVTLSLRASNDSIR